MSDLPKPAPRLNLHRPKPTTPRLTTKERGYGWQWQKTRFRKLKETPLCELRLEGCTGFAEHVHHHDHNTKNNKPENLFSACVSCHGKLHRNSGAGDR